MEYAPEQSGTPAASLQQSSCWYRAVTLTERLAFWLATDTAHALHKSSSSELAEKTLRQWKAQKPFDTGSFFADRLAMDALTEQDALALLMEPLEALQERLSHPATPDWITELLHALHVDPAPLPVAEKDQERFSQQFAMLQPLSRLLQKDIAHLQTGIAALARQYDALPFDPEAIVSLLLPNLFQQIGPQMSKTLVLELNIARLRGQLHGETAEARFKDYLHLLSQREHLQPLLEEYCVLARQVLISSELWADCSLEFVQRLCADWQEILAVFAPEQEPGVLTEVAGGAGDTHRGGHSVMVLTFLSGWHLLYKPKSLTIDTHFQELLAWLNNRGSQPAFRLLKLIDKGTHGWSEFIEAGGCSSVEEVARFYERQGGYLALLYMLEAIDFHHENVIAAGEHPLLIDLEALFHPRATIAAGETTPRPVQELLQHTVLRIGLLPWHLLANDGDEGLDISGLAQLEGQMSPMPIPQWEEAGTDEMKVVRKHIKIQGSKNSPRLNGQGVQSLDYLEQIIAGFTTIYRLLITYRDEMLTTWLPRFAHDEIRFLARATRTYDLLLTASFHPNMLRDALKRERLFDRLWLDVEFQPSLARLIPAERADLLRGDIPLFITQPESRGLWTSRGEYLPAFFEESSLELVSKRLQQLNEEDLQRQIWMIRASFTNMAGQRVSAVEAASDTSTSSAHILVGRQRLLAGAQAIGNRLCASALRDKEHADWFGLIQVFERNWEITSADLDLYSGLPGILLFLSYLGRITGEARYTTTAQSGLKTLRVVIQQNLAFFDQVGVGAFTGMGSSIYLFSHLAALWHDPSLLREAEELVQQLPGRIGKDEKYDLVDGAAGCIASLLSLHALVPSDQILKTAVQCGEHLLAHAEPMQEGLGWKARQQDVPLSGFSHGAAGIAWSLLRLAAVSGEERFRDAAEAALAYERSLFSPEQRNWLDVRKRPATASQQRDQAEPAQAQEARYGMSWSHGAPGIALGRLVSLPYIDDAAIRTEIEIALETTIADGFGYSHEHVGPNHSLAHGDCGNLETVLIAAQMLHGLYLQDHRERLTAHLLESMQQHGWVMGVPLNVETPGLMIGLAGIGYQCLRLAEPELVPSVLTLAAPLTISGSPVEHP